MGAGILGLVGAGLEAAQGIMNQVATRRENNRNRHHDREMMEMNAKYNLSMAKQMSDYNMKNQLNLFDATGYKAQVEQMKDAGLNVGMMYGMGGGGGQTASLSGGSASVGHSTTAGQPARTGMDITGAIRNAKEIELAEAQRKLIEAQTEKTSVEADKIGGVDTEKTKAETANLTQQVLESKTSMPDRMKLIENTVDKAVTELKIMQNDKTISDATVQDRIKQIKAQAVGATITNELMRTDINLKQEQVKEIEARINKMAEDIAQGWEKLSLEEKRIKIQEFSEEIKASYPSLFNVAGKVTDEGLRAIDKILSVIGINKVAGERKIN